MFLIFGLGNPGRQYDGTRHNIGFEVIDLLAKRHGIKIKASKFDAYAGEEFCLGSKMILVKPTTFMNLSGKAVRQFLRFYKLPEEDYRERLIIIYDDTDLPPGQIRIRQQGGAGGHNGMKNIIYSLETDEFVRIRVGVGGKAAGFTQAGHVLARFNKSEQDDAIKGIIAAADALEDIMRHGVAQTMNKQGVVEKKKRPAPRPYKNVHEFLEGIEKQSIDAKFVEKLNKKYNIVLDDYAGKILSKAPSGCFFEDDAVLSLLSRSWLLSAPADMEVDFASLQLIPIFNIADNDYIAYDGTNNTWCMFNIADDTKFNENKTLEALLSS